MRPHHLSFAGIGPYPRRVDINFDDLSELGLYLIVGPTGAGKTTIFDAMTYALYGELAGQRVPATIISDHAHREPSFVELDFSHRGSYYRVHRRPQANGSTTRGPDVQFVDFGTSPFIEPTNRITGTRAVTAEVVQLVGLTADQFMRVMLLPQNEFQEFLLANSRDKEELLRALFGTEMYRSVAEELAGSARQLTADAEAVQRELDAQRSALEGQLQIVRERHPDALPAEGSDLDDVISTLRVAVEDADRARTKADRESKDATRRSAIASNDAQRFDANQELQALVAEQHEQQPTVDDAERRRQLHDRAGDTAQRFGEHRLAVEAELETSTAVAHQRAELVDLVGRVPVEIDLGALRDLAATAAPNELQRASEAAGRQIVAAKDASARATEATTEAAELTRRADEADALAADLRAEADSHGERLRDAEQQLREAQQLASELDVRRTRLDELERLVAAADTDGTQQRLVAAQAESDQRERVFHNADEALSAARRARTLHLAGTLAEELSPGAPCPVCGSVDHPQPAAAVDDVNPDDLAPVRDDALRAFETSAAALVTAQEAAAAALAAAATLPSAQEQQLIREAAERASGAAASLGPLSVAVDEHRSRQSSAAKAADDHTATSATARRDAESRIAEVDSLRARPMAALPLAVLEAATEILDDIDGVIDQLVASIPLLAQQRALVEATATALDSAVERGGFGTADEGIAARLDDTAVHEIEATLTQSAARATRIIHCQGVIGDDPAPDERPDVDRVRLEAEAASVAAQLATATATTLSDTLEIAQRTAANLAHLGPDAANRLDRARRATQLADIMRLGKGELLGLERWVQRAAFEEVCEVATTQLLKLSAGRYVLTLSENGARDRRRAAGLDVFVTDGNTGVTRPAGTLSGGEQFLTSLALALALADVVQRRSGGIDLATLFIDEGFGSLDGETLDVAMDVLRSLHDSGRTVGVISHVDAMRHELPAGIEVRPSPTGSTLTVLPTQA